ncbi:MAG: TerB family tellurite resistance protein [Trueperaceae bacterium]
MEANPETPQLEIQQAIMSIALMAALADGQQSDMETAQFAKLSKEFSEDLFSDVASGDITLESQAALLTTPENKTQALELAIAVCHADGTTNEAETEFLNKLRKALGLASDAAQTTQQQANDLAEASVATPVVGANTVTDGADALENLILSHSVIAGALQLLPQGLANLAILPVQIKMVYQIAEKHGHKPNRENITDLLAVVGVGVASQVVTGLARGLLRGVAGRFLGGVAGAATDAALSFGTTFALGGVARKYYEQDRKINTEDLKKVFAERLEQGKALYSKYSGQVSSKANSLTNSDITAMLRGK